MSDESICSVCSRLTGFGDEDRFEPPVNLARCPAPGGLECRAVAQAVAPLRRENEVLRSNSDHLSSENASLARQVESMATKPSGIGRDDFKSARTALDQAPHSKQAQRDFADARQALLRALKENS